jgi:hypothetical protein
MTIFEAEEIRDLYNRIESIQKFITREKSITQTYSITQTDAKGDSNTISITYFEAQVMLNELNKELSKLLDIIDKKYNLSIEV